MSRDILFIGHANPENNEFTSWIQCKLINEGYAVDEDTGDVQKRYILRYYSVFNLSQCCDIPVSKLPPPNEKGEPQTVTSCEDIVMNMPLLPEINIAGQSAYYSPVTDIVTMPQKRRFNGTDGYYSTLFHELIHATGHQSRLNRKEVTDPNKFGSEPYSIEELVAELGTCYLKSFAGIDHDLSTNAAYIENWLQALSNDKRMIVLAGGRAQRATDFILNIKNETKAEVVAEAEEMPF